MKTIGYKIMQIIGIGLLFASYSFPDIFGFGEMGITMAASGVFLPKFTLSDEEIKDMKGLIVEDVFQKSPLNELMTVLPNIVSGKKIGIVGQMSDVGRPRTACATTTTDVTIPTIEKEWAPCSWGDRIPICAADLEDQFWVYILNKGVKRSDVTNTDFADFIASQVENGILEGLYKNLFFGDVDADTVDASPAGLLTSGTDKTLFTCQNGIWKQLFAIGTADSNRRVTISKNAEATYAAQAFNATDTTNLVATGIFRDLIQKSHLKARTKMDRNIYCTLSLADQYSNELETQTGIAAAWVMKQDGIKVLNRLGVNIIAIPYWSHLIETYFDNGASYYRPHRAVMISKDNWAIGCEGEEYLSEYDMWFSRDDNKNYVEFLTKIDSKVFVDNMVQIAY